jgi:D-aminopeptidase
VSDPIDPILVSPNGRRRGRSFALPIPGIPGRCNAITDVPGVAVGFTTLIADGESAVRTGVTAILPRSADELLDPVWAGSFSMNGNGEMTGVHWIKEAGWLTGPITITNTFSVGLAHHAATRWMIRRFRPKFDESLWVLPVAAETYDGWLNDIAGQHVTEADVLAAIDGAKPGPVAEGNVGGGTGMIAYEFKAGTGTASRQVALGDEVYTVGVLVQANHGLRPWLNVCGVPVGAQLPGVRLWGGERGSIIVVVATNAPLIPTQIERLARRAALGIGRGGTPSGNNSGDIFVAFSTANAPGPLPEPPTVRFTVLGNERLDPLFLGVVEAVDEAVLNAMLGAETMVGHRGHQADAIDGEGLVRIVGAARQASSG